MKGRLWVRARFLGFTRGISNQHENHSILQLEGVNARADSSFYLGKRVVFLYKCKAAKKNSNGRETKVRAIWGKITKPHGNNGKVQARFVKNLPPRAMGSIVRVMLYPSTI